MAADTDNWVNTAGDTMTGALALPANGLVAGTDQLVLSGGNVGIGTTSPQRPLHIASTSTPTIIIEKSDELADQRKRVIGMSGSALAFGKFSDTLTWTEHMRIDIDGNVGIGTTSPGCRLDIATVVDIHELAFTGIENASIYVPSANFYLLSGIGKNLNFGTNGLHSRMVMDASGNVGIGTTSPQALLEVAGDTAALRINANATGKDGHVYEFVALDSDDGTGGDLAGCFGIVDKTINDTILRIDPSGYVGIAVHHPAGRFHVNANGGSTIGLVVKEDTGNVGFGTTSPTEKLDVVGNIAVSGTVDGRDVAADGTKLDGITATAADTTNDSWTGTGNVYTTSGNVGIGTTSPQAPLHVKRTGSGTCLILQTSDSSSSNGVGINFTEGTGAVIGAINVIGEAPSKAGIAFSTWDSGPGERLRIQANGNVGIGTTTPAQKLDVVGNIAVSGTVDGRDVAADGTKLDGITATAADTTNDSWTGTGNVYTTSGNVGIGTTNPGGGLAIASDINLHSYKSDHNLLLLESGTEAGDTGIALFGYGSGVDAAIFHDDADANKLKIAMSSIGSHADRQASTKVTIQQDGNVGIGTTAPSVKLQVAGDIVSTNSLAVPSNIGFARLLYNPTSGIGMLQAYDSSINEYKDFKAEGRTWRIDTGTSSLTTGLYQDSVGNVGIGTTAPNAKLDIHGADIILDNGCDTSSKIYFNEGTSGHVYSLWYDGTASAPNNYLKIKAEHDQWTDELFRMDMLGNTYIKGNVGIGTTSPVGILEVQTATGSASVYLGSADGSGSQVIFFRDGGTDEWHIGRQESDNSLRLTETGVLDRLTIIPGGNIGIGITSPTEKLHVVGNILATGSITPGSSREFKENISGLSTPEALETLAGLKAVKFNYKADKSDQHVGFIAEDVPELVATPDRKGLAPMDIVGVLTTVVQEQQEQMQLQDQRLQKQQREIDELKTLLHNRQ